MFFEDEISFPLSEDRHDSNTPERLEIDSKIDSLYERIGLFKLQRNALAPISRQSDYLLIYWPETFPSDKSCMMRTQSPPSHLYTNADLPDLQRIVQCLERLAPCLEELLLGSRESSVRFCFSQPLPSNGQAPMLRPGYLSALTRCRIASMIANFNI
ncbi:hypothetical protein BDN72DRAFT_851020, partial [Pluteus cervinus]